MEACIIMASCVERMAYTRGPTVALLIVGVLGPSTNRMQCLSLEQSSKSYAKKPLHHVGTKYSLQAVSCAQRLMILYSNLGVGAGNNVDEAMSSSKKVLQTIHSVLLLYSCL